MKLNDILVSILISIAAYIVIRIAIQHADISFCLLTILGGVLLLVYRHTIGGYTDYTSLTCGFGYINKSTPGCLLIPFGISIIILGSALLIKSVK